MDFAALEDQLRSSMHLFHHWGTPRPGADAQRSWLYGSCSHLIILTIYIIMLNSGYGTPTFAGGMSQTWRMLKSLIRCLWMPLFDQVFPIKLRFGWFTYLLPFLDRPI